MTSIPTRRASSRRTSAATRSATRRGGSPSLGYDHVFRMSSGNTLTFHADITYKSEFFTQFYNYDDLRQDAYTQSNASLDFARRAGSSCRLYVRNIEDKRYLTNASLPGGGSGRHLELPVRKPATVRSAIQ